MRREAAHRFEGLLAWLQFRRFPKGTNMSQSKHGTRAVSRRQVLRHRRRRRRRAAGTAWTFNWARSNPSHAAVTKTRTLMGTTVNLTVLGPDRDAANTAVDATFARMEALESRLSRYRADSEVGRLNASGAIDDAGDDLRALLTLGRELHAMGDGRVRPHRPAAARPVPRPPRRARSFRKRDAAVERSDRRAPRAGRRRRGEGRRLARLLRATRHGDHPRWHRQGLHRRPRGGRAARPRLFQRPRRGGRRPGRVRREGGRETLAPRHPPSPRGRWRTC